MTNNNNYYYYYYPTPSQMEELDDRYLKFFNEHKHFFIIPNTTERETEKYSVIDRQLKDIKNRPCAIELKTRFCDINTFDGIFIEDKKWEALQKEYKVNNKIPLYINFFYDEKRVLIFDLRPYFDRKKQVTTKYVDINNKGYKRTDKNQLRFILPQRDGTYYEYDQQQDTYIKKWG